MPRIHKYGLFAYSYIHSLNTVLSVLFGNLYDYTNTRGYLGDNFDIIQAQESNCQKR